MEKVIALSLFLMVWIMKDKQVSKWLFGLTEMKVSQYMLVINEITVQKFHENRIKHLQIARFLLLPVVIISDSNLVFMICILFIFFVYKFEYYRLQIRVQKRIRNIRYQFPIYLRQLQVLLQNNTVTKAIEASLDQVPELFKEDIVSLHKRLVDNPMNLNSYMACMAQYNLPEIQRAMKWLYRYQSIGLSDVNRQFNRMITSTSKWLRQSRLSSKEQSLAIYQWWGILPLFGVTIVFLSAMVSVATSFFERR